ncbi:MAG: RICIN domain-containing protein [Bacteroidaceae bacterium]|nr:RICIN domain-containing protein [Bacteroidaceae bacterium]
MKRTLILCTVALLGLCVSAQNNTTSSSSMTANPWTENIPYDIAVQGKKQSFVAGMGGWSWDFFAYKQRNWVGKEYLNIARVGFLGENNTSSSEPTSLTSTQKSTIDTELNNIAPTGAKRLLLLCDMDPASSGKLSESNWTASSIMSATKDKRRRANYVKQIALGVEYIESKGYKVVAVAPFNEPDYDANGNCGKSAKAFNAVAEVMQGNATLKGRVFGPNTLNDTEGKKWYSTVKNNINFVNTHQLAGSFEDLISFWDTGVKDGKRAIADEMHNVLEAMVAVNHGAEYGAWWAYDGVARAEFSHLIADGSQLAYVEDIDHFAVAGVYRYDDEADRAKILIGTSERQATPATFGFLSKGRLAYYDGNGPVYDYTEDVPGGTDYWTGQTNAERLIQIHTGEDVPIEPVNGKYKLVNKASGKVLSLRDGSLVRQSVYQWTDGGKNNQVWDVYPVDKTTVADYSYVVIRNANTSSIPLYLDAQAWNMDAGAEASVWSDGDALSTLPNVWQRWHLDYVGDGYYHVINYESGLYLAVDGGNTANGANVHQWTNDGSDKLLWKFVPADNKVDATAPAAPTGLTATPLSGSIKLSWKANTESDIYGYMVYRYNDDADIWECIGRKVKGTNFIDNTCRKGQTLSYRIKAIDQAYNFSGESSKVTTKTLDGNALVGHWMGMSFDDNTENKLHAVPYDVTLTTNEEKAAFSFDGSDDYLKLPYHVGDMQQMTFAAWVKGSSTTAWQRIFDFGNGEDEYLFLTPTNGSKMRFEIKKDGVTQGLNATTTLGTGKWKHVAVTIGANEVAIYIDGVKNASTSNITIRPSDVAPTLSYLGRSQFIADPAFKGYMSNVRIYNYALSAAEVKALTSTSVTPEDIEAATRAAVAEALELLKQPMWNEVKTALQQAVDKVNSAAATYIAKLEKGTATSSDSQAWSNAMSELAEGNAVPNAKASIEVYKTLAAQMSIAHATKAAHPSTYGNKAFGTETGAVQKNYSGGIYADSEIPAAVNEVKGITNRYLLADAMATATKNNPIDVTALVVEQAGFDNDSYAGWTASPTPGVAYGSVEFWNTNFHILQILYGMPAGSYRLQTRAFYRYGYQGDNYTAHNNGTLKRHAKIYISHPEGENLAEVMAISDDPSEDTYWGRWSAEKYDGKPVPDDMQAGAHAIDGCGKYQPKNGYNTVDITVSEIGDITIGAKKETFVAGDWSFFGDFSLYCLGDGVQTLELKEDDEKLPAIDERKVYDKVIVRRTIKANYWSTFVIPFDMKVPAGWEVKELVDATRNGDAICLDFKDVGAEGAHMIKAGVPYMVRVKEKVEKIEGENVQVSKTLTIPGTGCADFVGVYEVSIMPVGAFYISNNVFYRTAEGGKNRIKAFRAYITPHETVNALSFRVDEDVDTNVESVAEEPTVVTIYNANGVRIDDMQEGLNILLMSDGSRVKVMNR